MRVVETLNEFINNKSPNKSITIKSDFLGELVKNFIIPMKHKGFLTEMTLSYLISYQEAMLKDYLYGILINKKSALKSSKKITYDEVLKFTSMKSLIANLAQKEVDQLGYGSIDDVEKYFKDKFNVQLSNFDGWDDLVESTFRRNLLIHNRGVTNDQYCKRIGYPKRKVKLDVDIDYVVNVAENIISFNDFCFELFKSKFKLA